MSEELTGRARGRARGRSRLQPSHSEARMPGTFASQQSSTAPQETVRAGLPQHELMGRAKVVRRETSISQLGKQMGSVSLTAGQGEGAAAAGVVPSRGGTRRRYEEANIPTKPTTCDSKQGKSGTLVTLKANYFKLNTVTDFTLYQYRVDFAPEEERTGVRKGLLYIHKDTLGPYMFDGTVLFTRKKIENIELYSCRTQDEAKIRITIKKTTDLVYGDPQYIQFFNIVLRKCIAGLNLQLVGRDYYDVADKVIVAKHNLELWPGFVTSIRQHESDILLGVELASKIMRKDTALHLMNEISGRTPNWQKLFIDAIVGTTVITPYNNKTYRVDDVDFEISPMSTFEKGKERISYIDYYSKRYGVRINELKQPLLVSRPKLRDIRGGRTDNVILVPELCCLTGLSDDMRNNFHLMRDLEEHTRLAPGARMGKVTSFLKRLTSNKQAEEELSLWNLNFSPDLVELAGRILAPEKILHGDNKVSEGNREADWTRSLRGQAMFRSQNFHTWVIIYLRRSQRDVESFVRTLTNASASLKFKIPPPQFEDIMDDRAGTYVQVIEKVVSRSNPQLIMCIVPNNRKDRYDAIKKKCCVDRAVPSQVVLSKNLTSKNAMSIATKIGIQVNCKIGGSPWSVIVPFIKPVMVVGYDACHDSTTKGRSFGAMVASLDGAYSRYYSAASPHTSGEELSNDLSLQLVKAVTVYRRVNKFLPPKIIIYRDGVGEGNEHYVLNHEVEEIRKKLQSVYQEEPLNLAYVLVTKRIMTRLFYKNGNPPPGTLADDIITSPTKYDFFLVSQSSKVGTVAPTSFNVIYDTTQLSPDIMQKLAYKMTHLYFNWSGTVRVPAPVQCAHKLAFLCGQHLHRRPNEDLNEFLYFL